MNERQRPNQASRKASDLSPGALSKCLFKTLATHLRNQVHAAGISVSCLVGAFANCKVHLAPSQASNPHDAPFVQHARLRGDQAKRSFPGSGQTRNTYIYIYMYRERCRQALKTPTALFTLQKTKDCKPCAPCLPWKRTPTQPQASARKPHGRIG